jgi:hypothetical protein
VKEVHKTHNRSHIWWSDFNARRQASRREQEGDEEQELGVLTGNMRHAERREKNKRVDACEIRTHEKIC